MKDAIEIPHIQNGRIALIQTTYNCYDDVTDLKLFDSSWLLSQIIFHY